MQCNTTGMSEAISDVQQNPAGRKAQNGTWCQLRWCRENCWEWTGGDGWIQPGLVLGFTWGPGQGGFF